MIISVAEAKKLVEFKGWSDEKIERKLKVVEQAIRSHTHNNFQDIDCRRAANIVGGSLLVEDPTPFGVGDTVMITETKLNKGLFTVLSVDVSSFTVAEDVKDESNVLVTKVYYPEDVVDCAIEMLEWEVDGKQKAKKGIQSETLSRHSVTYTQQTDANTKKGYPASIMSALKPYMKARF